MAPMCLGHYIVFPCCPSRWSHASKQIPQCHYRNTDLSAQMIFGLLGSGEVDTQSQEEKVRSVGQGHSISQSSDHQRYNGWCSLQPGWRSHPSRGLGHKCKWLCFHTGRSLKGGLYVFHWEWEKVAGKEFLEKLQREMTRFLLCCKQRMPQSLPDTTLTSWVEGQWHLNLSWIS